MEWEPGMCLKSKYGGSIWTWRQLDLYAIVVIHCGRLLVMSGSSVFSRVLVSCKQNVSVWVVSIGWVVSTVWVVSTDLLLQYGCSLLKFFGGLLTVRRAPKITFLRVPAGGCRIIGLVVVGSAVLPKQKSADCSTLSVFIWKKLETKARIGGVKVASSLSFFFSVPKMSSSCPSKEPTTSSSAPAQMDTSQMTALSVNRVYVDKKQLKEEWRR